MSDYYNYYLLTFVDGSMERVGGNDTSLRDGVLTIRTLRNYSGAVDVHHYPLGNLREWHKEERR